MTKQNPLDSLTALKNIQMVVINGREIINPKVKKMSQVESELDKCMD